MNITLPAPFEAMIRQKIETGDYTDASEVVEDALRQMDERDRKLQALRAAVAVGLEQIERGEVVEWTPRYMEEVKQRARQRTGEGRPVNDAVKP